MTDVTQRRPAPANLVVAATLLMFSTAAGQTFFIGLFANDLKAVLDLTDGGFGGLYTAATLASATVLIWAGKVVDHFRVRWLAVAAIIGLAFAAVAMANVAAPWMLFLVFLCLRFFGQGALSHIAIAGVARWYLRRRGRMMSIAVMGIPASEAVMPIIVVSLNATIGWRVTWYLMALFLIAVAAPLVRLLLHNEPAHDAPAPESTEADLSRRQWTRAEVLRLPEYYAVLGGIAVPAFVVTGVFFHQAALVVEKSWSLTWFAAWFPLYAAGAVVTALVIGGLIDRIGARRIMPFYLLPMAVGVATLALWASPFAVPVFMLLAAFTVGSSSTLVGAAWAELFGTRNLGAIRATAIASQVVASALAPGLMGVLLDAGIPLTSQFLAMLVYALLSSAWLSVMMPRLHRLAGV